MQLGAREGGRVHKQTICLSILQTETDKLHFIQTQRITHYTPFSNSERYCAAGHSNLCNEWDLKPARFSSWHGRRNSIYRRVPREGCFAFGTFQIELFPLLFLRK